MQHDRTAAAVVFGHIFRADTLRQHYVALQRPALPRPAERILDVRFDLRTVERALAGQFFPRHGTGRQRFAQTLLGAIPRFVRAGARARAQRQFDVDMVETEVLVHTHRERIERDRLADELVFGTENVRVVLHETAHAHETMQRARRLVAMARTELRITQRQVWIRTQPASENLTLTRAI